MTHFIKHFCRPFICPKLADIVSFFQLAEHVFRLFRYRTLIENSVNVSLSFENSIHQSLTRNKFLFMFLRLQQKKFYSDVSEFGKNAVYLPQTPLKTYENSYSCFFCLLKNYVHFYFAVVKLRDFLPPPDISYQFLKNYSKFGLKRTHCQGIKTLK